MSKINILLPFKEKFSKNLMSSISISVKANLEESVYKKQIKIFGQYVSDPLYKDLFIGIKKPIIPLFSKNINLAKKMCDEINKSKNKNPIVEIHNRPYLVKLINKKIKNYKIILFFHNDPIEMKGSKAIKERLYLINNCSAICFVSEYIKKQFLSEININPKNLNVIHNGIGEIYKAPKNKIKNIIFVGRLVKDKGVHLFLDAVKTLSTKYKSWNFIVVGSPYLGNIKTETKFSKYISLLINQLGSNVKLTGYLPYSESQSIINKSEIMVIPSIWNEPFGLVVAEGMMHGCAIITSDNGGIPEVIKNKGIVLKDINANQIASSIELLINDYALRKEFQKKASQDFPFTSKKSSKSLDDLRKKII